MARPIDADAFITKYCHECKEQSEGKCLRDICGRCKIFEAVNGAPTIETAPKWIPCSERLPEQSGIYFVCFTFDDGTHAADISYINVSRGLGHITHWMPLELPAPESDRT